MLNNFRKLIVAKRNDNDVDKYDPTYIDNFSSASISLHIIAKNVFIYCMHIC